MEKKIFFFNNLRKKSKFGHKRLTKKNSEVLFYLTQGHLVLTNVQDEIAYKPLDYLAQSVSNQF